MRNVTITMDDERYRKARVWAAERSTNISAVVKYLLNILPVIPIAQKSFPLKPGPTPAPPSATPAPAVPVTTPPVPPAPAP